MPDDWEFEDDFGLDDEGDLDDEGGLDDEWGLEDEWDPDDGWDAEVEGSAFGGGPDAEDEHVDAAWGGVAGLGAVEAVGWAADADEVDRADDAGVGHGDAVPGGDLTGAGGIGAGTAAGPTGQGKGGEPMQWSAWDVGVVFGLGGWMLDRHAEQIGDQVRAALAGAGTAREASDVPRGAPRPAPTSGHRYGADAGRLVVDGPLRLGAMHTELVAAIREGRDLLIQAEADGPSGGRLVLVVSAVAGTVGPRLWVVAEHRPGGFAASRLVPIFQADPSGGFAVFATDHADEAADAVAWACTREGVRPEELTVHRQV